MTDALDTIRNTIGAHDIVDVVVPRAAIPGFLRRAREIADKMLAKSPLGLKLTKEVANQNIGAASLESALYMEDRNQVLCLAAAPIRNPLKGKKK